MAKKEAERQREAAEGKRENMLIKLQSDTERKRMRDGNKRT